MHTVTAGQVTLASNGESTLITQSRAENPRFKSTVLESFKGGTTGKCSASVTNPSMTSGIAWLTSKQKLVTLYKSRLVPKENETDTVFLGTASNSPTQLRPKTVGQEVLRNVLLVVDKDKVPDGVPFGIPIDKDESVIKHHFYEADGTTLTDSNEKVVVRVAVSFPIGYGALLKTGKIDQSTYDCVEHMDSSGYISWQVENLASHNSELQLALITHASTKKYLPAITSPIGYSLIPSPFLKADDIDDADEDLEDDVTNLGAECMALVTKNLIPTSPTPTSVTLVRESPLGHRKEENPEDGKIAAQTEKEQKILSLTAFGVIYNPAAKTVTAPTISDHIDGIFNMSTKRGQRDTTDANLELLGEIFGDSDHFLLRSVDQPSYDTITLAHISQGKFANQMVDSLEAKVSNGFTVPQLMPDTQATSKVKKEKDNINDAEDALGEHASKRTKLDTSFTAVNELTNMGFLLGTEANILVLLALYYTFDVMNAVDLPTVVFHILQIAKDITCVSARRWMKANGALKQQFLYYVLNQIISIMTCYGRASKDVLVKNAIKSGNFGAVPTNHYDLAHTIFKDTTQKIAQVFLSSTEIPATTLYLSSTVKKRADERQQKKLLADLKLSVGTGTGKHGRGNPPRSDDARQHKKLKQTGVGNEKDGWLTVTVANFELCPEVNSKDFRMCKSSARSGVTCPFKDKCNFVHTTSINDLPKDKRKPFVLHIDKLDGVDIDEKDTVLAAIRSS